MKYAWPISAPLDRAAKSAARGDREAFRRLYRGLHPQVRRYLRRRCSDDAAVDDLCAVTFERLIAGLANYEAGRGSIRALAITIARNALIDHVRRQGREVSAPDLDAVVHLGADQEEMAVRDEQLQLVRKLLADQPVQVRQMFALRFSEGLRYREIAVVMDTSEAAVKQRFSRTLRFLKEETTRREREDARRYAT